MNSRYQINYLHPLFYFAHLKIFSLFSLENCQWQRVHLPKCQTWENGSRFWQLTHFLQRDRQLTSRQIDSLVIKLISVLAASDLWKKRQFFESSKLFQFTLRRQQQQHLFAGREGLRISKSRKIKRKRTVIDDIDGNATKKERKTWM